MNQDGATSEAEPIGAYQVVRRLRGAERDIYLARKGLGAPEQLLVVVEADRDATVGLTRELARLRTIEDESILKPVETFGLKGQRTVLVFGDFSGASLHRVMRQLATDAERMALSAVCYIGARIGGALAAAHTALDPTGAVAPMIHTHMAPEQVLLAWTGDVRLLGLGLGPIMEASHLEARARGTEAYVAPELRGKNAPSTIAANVYSLAAIMWALFCGRAPPLAGPIEPVATLRGDVPPRISEAIERDMNPDPAVRSIGCRELADLLALLGVPKGRDELRWNLEIFRALIAIGDDDVTNLEAFPVSRPRPSLTPKSDDGGPTSATDHVPTPRVAAKPTPATAPATTSSPAAGHAPRIAGPRVAPPPARPPSPTVVGLGAPPPFRRAPSSPELAGALVGDDADEVEPVRVLPPPPPRVRAPSGDATGTPRPAPARGVALTGDKGGAPTTARRSRRPISAERSPKPEAARAAQPPPGTAAAPAAGRSEAFPLPGAKRLGDQEPAATAPKAGPDAQRGKNDGTTPKTEESVTMIRRWLDILPLAGGGDDESGPSASWEVADAAAVAAGAPAAIPAPSDSILNRGATVSLDAPSKAPTPPLAATALVPAASEPRKADAFPMPGGLAPPAAKGGAPPVAASSADTRPVPQPAAAPAAGPVTSTSRLSAPRLSTPGAQPTAAAAPVPPPRMPERTWIGERFGKPLRPSTLMVAMVFGAGIFAAGVVVGTRMIRDANTPASTGEPPPHAGTPTPVTAPTPPPTTAMPPPPPATTSAPTTAPATTPPSAAASASEPPSDASELPEDQGFLVVQAASVGASVFVNGVRLGPTGKPIAVPCGDVHVRLGVMRAARRSWVSGGKMVTVTCRGTTLVELQITPEAPPPSTRPGWVPGGI